MKYPIALLAAALSAPLLASSPEATVELLAENTSLHPGQNWIGLSIQPASGWHVYWQNPGDVGQPTQIELVTPPGVSAGDMRWPVPRVRTEAGMTSFVYEQPVLHLIPVTVDARAPRIVDFTASVSYVVCHDTCIPQHADLKLSLPVAKTAKVDRANTDDFAKARETTPIDKADWIASYDMTGDLLTVEICGDGAGKLGSPAVFPLADELVNYAVAPRYESNDENHLRLLLPLSKTHAAVHGPLGFVLAGPSAVAITASAQPGLTRTIAMTRQVRGACLAAG
ncbi:MAG TPA: protein-disulfide reductase DsbD domain-containing protein [Nevskiaceae bacterium]|nr:protein-disulfide reductase DsbD domain-containing protein [Nevskiaceae bacterium]